jgi:hypothetical protein
MKKSLLYYKINELKEIAEKKKISLKGLRLKKDIVNKIAKKLGIDPNDAYVQKEKQSSTAKKEKQSSTAKKDNPVPAVDVSKLKLYELKAYAIKENISLKGLRLKKDIVEKIRGNRVVVVQKEPSSSKNNLSKEAIMKMSLIELKDLAKKENISLKGLRLKKDIAEKIISQLLVVDKEINAKDISKLKVKELKELAKTKNISLKGATLKVDILRLLSYKNKIIRLNGPKSFSYFKDVKNKTNKYKRNILLLGEKHVKDQKCWYTKDSGLYYFITNLVEEKKECFDIFVEIPHYNNIIKPIDLQFGEVLSTLEKFETSKSPFIRYHQVDYRYTFINNEKYNLSFLYNFNIITRALLYDNKKFLSKSMQEYMINLSLGDTKDASLLIDMVFDMHLHYNKLMPNEQWTDYIKWYINRYIQGYSKILEKRYKKLDGSVEEFKKAYRKAAKERYEKSVYDRITSKTAETMYLNHTANLMDVPALLRLLTIYNKPVGKQHQCDMYNKNIILGAGDYHIILYEYFFAFYTKSKPIVSDRNIYMSCVEVENPFIE